MIISAQTSPAYHEHKHLQHIMNTNISSISWTQTSPAYHEHKWGITLWHCKKVCTFTWM